MTNTAHSSLGNFNRADENKTNYKNKFRELFKFDGEIGRKEFALTFVLTSLAIRPIVIVIGACVGFACGFTGMSGAALPLYYLLVLATGLAALGIQIFAGIKRFRNSHNGDFPEWAVAAALLIPIISLITFIYLALAPSKRSKSVDQELAA